MELKFETKKERHNLTDVVPLPSPYIVHVDPCGICNFKCTFCPCNYSDYRKKERHTKMSMDTFSKVVNGLAEFSPPVRVVNLYGFGEPLINENVPEMVKKIRPVISADGGVRIVTNGSLLSPELNFKLIDAGTKIIRISLNGLNSEEYFKTTGVKVDFDKLILNIKDLFEQSRDTNTEVSVKIMTNNTENDENTKRFIEIFAPISDSYFVETQGNIWPYFGVKDIEKSYARKMATDFYACPAMFISMTIFSNGNVGLCSSDWRMDTVIDNIHNRSLKEIWNSSELREFRILNLKGERDKIPSCDVCKTAFTDEIDENNAKIILRKFNETI